MAKKKDINIKGLLKSANSLKKIFGSNITLSEIIKKLEIEESNEQNVTQSKFDDLRDYLLAMLINNLVKKGYVEAGEPITLKVLDRANLKDVIEQYFDGLNSDNSTSNEQNTVYLLYSCGDDAFDYLHQCVKTSIDKWGIDKVINEFVNNPKDLSILNIKFKWLYNSNCDDYDCYTENGSAIDILEKKYGEENMLEYATVDTMYDFILHPHDLVENNEFQYLEVERISSVPTKMEFFLLVWKYFAMEKEK